MLMRHIHNENWHTIALTHFKLATLRDTCKYSCCIYKYRSKFLVWVKKYQHDAGTNVWS